MGILALEFQQEVIPEFLRRKLSMRQIGMTVIRVEDRFDRLGELIRRGVVSDRGVQVTESVGRRGSRFGKSRPSRLRSRLEHVESARGDKPSRIDWIDLMTVRSGMVSTRVSLTHVNSGSFWPARLPANVIV